MDSNVLLDVITEDEAFFAWSSSALTRLAEYSQLYINPLIYAEVSVRYPRREELDLALSPVMVRREALPWEAAFLAGKSFVAYRRRGGTRRSSLPDFYIGAHAAVRGFALLTRDAERYRTYFPGLEIHAP